MDTKERHIRENESNEKREIHAENAGYEAGNNLRSQGKDRKNNGIRRTNRLWIWLGVIILIFILVWWLWTIGTAEDITGVTNG